MSGTCTSRLVTFLGHNTKTSNQNWDRIPNWLFPPVFLSCGRSISWICWCFYTVSSLTVSKVHCSFNERLMLKEYLIKCFIVRCFRKSYFWCYETSIFFSRESPFFPRLGKHYVSKEFWFLILFSEKKNEIPEGFYFRGENNMFVFQNRMGLQIGKNFCEQFFQYANDNSQELATVQTVGDAPIHALLDVCLDFHSVRSSRTSPSGGHFDRAV